MRIGMNRRSRYSMFLGILDVLFLEIVDNLVEPNFFAIYHSPVESKCCMVMSESGFVRKLLWFLIEQIHCRIDVLTDG